VVWEGGERKLTPYPILCADKGARGSTATRASAILRSVLQTAAPDVDSFHAIVGILSRPLGNRIM